MGAGRACSAIYRDVTQERIDEQALREARDAAEDANRAKSEFRANMSHDSQWNGIIGMTELALDTPLDSEQREYLNNVKASGDALLTILNDILDFSKIEAGKMGLEAIGFFDALGDLGYRQTLALRAHQQGLEPGLRDCARRPRCRAATGANSADPSQSGGQCTQVHAARSGRSV